MSDAVVSPTARRAVSWHAALLGVSLGIVALNCALSIAAPSSAFPWDEAFLMDGVWRIAQGQVTGVDFYNPIGFAPFHLAALFWHAIGPSRATLALANGVLAAAIAVCAWVIVRRRPALRGWPGWLFCVAIVIEATAPSVYGWPFSAIGPSAFYNRLTTAALAVIFMQWFVAPDASHPRERFAEAVCAAVLCTVIFVVKIAPLGPAGGIMLLALLVRSDRARLMWGQIPLTVLLFVVFSAALFLAAGVHPAAVFRMYGRAADARAELASFDAMGRAAGGWLSFFGLAVLAVQAFGLIRDGAPVWRAVLVLAAYLLFQTVLNVSNTQPGTAYLAPAAAAILAAWHRALPGSSAIPGPLAMSGPRPRRAFVESAGRMALLLVAVPGGLASVYAAGLVVATAAGFVVPAVMTGPSGLRLPVIADFRGGDDTRLHAISIDRGLRDLRMARLDRMTVASLDYDNPFPPLLGAPSPAGADVVLAPSYMEPGARLFDPVEIIGDACVLMVPAHPAPVIAGTAQFLAASIAPVMDRFHQVWRDDWWRIYLRNDCAGPAASDEGLKPLQDRP